MKENMTFEQILEDPSLERFHEAIHFLEKTKDEILFPKKYMGSLKHTVTQMIIELHAKTPDLPIIKVVAHILDRLYDKIPAEMVLEITPHIVEKWKKEQLSTAQKAMALQIA